VPIVLKSGSLNLLEPSGPVQACNGSALPFPLIFYPMFSELPNCIAFWKVSRFHPFVLLVTAACRWRGLWSNVERPELHLEIQSVTPSKHTPSVSFQTNQPTRCNNFSSLLLDVYVRFNMFRASSRPSSGAQQLQ